MDAIPFSKHIEFMLQENMTTTVYQHFIHSLKHEYLNRRHFPHAEA